MEYEIQLTPVALEMLAAIKDRREQEKLRDRIDQLKTDPENKGKHLWIIFQVFAVFELLGNAIALFTERNRSRFSFW